MSGFRSFANPVEFDLDADVVLLSGPNGTGKTSVVDAVLWALIGRIARLGDEQNPIISVYSPDGIARVRLSLSNQDSAPITIDRSFDGERMTLKVVSGQQEWVKKDAESYLYERLWSRLDLASTDLSAVESVFTKSTYLQQDVVTQFVQDDDVGRFKAISALVGSRQIADLQSALESARNAWRRAQTARTKEVDEAESDYRRFGDLLERLPDKDPGTASTEKDWVKWLSQLQSEGIAIGNAVPDAVTSSSARADAESLTKEVRLLRRDLDRRIEFVSEAVDILGDEVESTDISVREAKLELSIKELNLKTESRNSIHKKIQQEKERILNLRDTNAQIAEMARLALLHLGEKCPVCTQSIDEDATRAHLESLLEGQERSDMQIDTSELRRIESEIFDLQKLTTDEIKHLESIRQREAAATRKLERVADLAREAGLEVNSTATYQLLVDVLHTGSKNLRNRRNLIADLLETGESLLLSITRISEYAQRDEIEKNFAGAEVRLGQLLQIQKNYELTYNTATRVIEGLREAATKITQQQIKAVEPRLKKIYSRIDPHPAFTTVRMNVFMRSGKGHAKVLVNDEYYDDVEDQEPKFVFSSSQLNALAVSAFLAFNLQSMDMPLSTAILDDPLQSLDDVNLLGLVDVLRRMKGQRQLILTTHDHRFLKVLARKFRPANESESLLSIAFSDWNRTGPNFDIHRSQGRPNVRSVVLGAA